jgi:hypothetical protein
LRVATKLHSITRPSLAYWVILFSGRSTLVTVPLTSFFIQLKNSGIAWLVKIQFDSCFLYFFETTKIFTFDAFRVFQWCKFLMFNNEQIFIELSKFIDFLWWFQSLKIKIY